MFSRITSITSGVLDTASYIYKTASETASDAYAAAAETLSVSTLGQEDIYFDNAAMSDTSSMSVEEDSSEEERLRQKNDPSLVPFRKSFESLRENCKILKREIKKIQEADKKYLTAQILKNKEYFSQKINYGSCPSDKFFSLPEKVLAFHRNLIPKEIKERSTMFLTEQILIHNPMAKSLFSWDQIENGLYWNHIDRTIKDMPCECSPISEFGVFISKDEYDKVNEFVSTYIKIAMDSNINDADCFQSLAILKKSIENIAQATGFESLSEFIENTKRDFQTQLESISNSTLDILLIFIHNEMQDVSPSSSKRWEKIWKFKLSKLVNLVHSRPDLLNHSEALEQIFKAFYNLREKNSYFFESSKKHTAELESVIALMCGNSDLLARALKLMGNIKHLHGMTYATEAFINTLGCLARHVQKVFCNDAEKLKLMQALLIEKIKTVVDGISQSHDSRCLKFSFWDDIIIFTLQALTNVEQTEKLLYILSVILNNNSRLVINVELRTQALILLNDLMQNKDKNIALAAQKAMKMINANGSATQRKEKLDQAIFLAPQAMEKKSPVSKPLNEIKSIDIGSMIDVNYIAEIQNGILISEGLCDASEALDSLLSAIEGLIANPQDQFAKDFLRQSISSALPHLSYYAKYDETKKIASLISVLETVRNNLA